MANAIERAAQELERMFGIKKSRRARKSEYEPTDELERETEESKRDEDEHDVSDENLEAERRAARKQKEVAGKMNKARGSEEEDDDEDDWDEEEYDDEDEEEEPRKSRKSRRMKKSRTAKKNRESELDDDYADWEDEEDLPEDQHAGEEFEDREDIREKSRRGVKKARPSIEDEEDEEDGEDHATEAIRDSQNAYMRDSGDFIYGEEEDIPPQEGVDDDDDTIVTNLGRRIRFKKKSMRAVEPTREGVYKSLAADQQFAEVVEASDALAHMTDVHAAAFDALYREIRKSRREAARLSEENKALRKENRVIAKSLHALMEQQAEILKALRVEQSLQTTPWGIPFAGAGTEVNKSVSAQPVNLGPGQLQDIIEKSLAAGHITYDDAQTMMINISSVDGAQRVVSQLREKLGAKVAKSFGL